MQEENARDKKQYAAALGETKLEFRFVHFLILAKRTKRHGVTAVNGVCTHNRVVGVAMLR
jgi:hypothetical protein